VDGFSVDPARTQKSPQRQITDQGKIMETSAALAQPENLQTEQEPVTETLYFVRLNDSEKRQHMVFLICFIVLAITGFMLKVPIEVVGKLGRFGEPVFYYRSLLHRLAGTLMILVSIYHVYYLIFKRAGRRWLFDMLPRFKDLQDMIGNLLYFINVNKQPPEFDRFSYKHKMEYGALILGTTLMSATGLMLWTESRWSKFILDIATLVHGMEAVLACLAIMVWHMYEIHLKPHKSPLDNTWLTGLVDEAEMKAEYPLQYKKIMNDKKLQEIYLRKG
jgi:cytochrome b subunit of formate dehydrogenase